MICAAFRERVPGARIDVPKAPLDLMSSDSVRAFAAEVRSLFCCRHIFICLHLGGCGVPCLEQPMSLPAEHSYYHSGQWKEGDGERAACT